MISIPRSGCPIGISTGSSNISTLVSVKSKYPLTIDSDSSVIVQPVSSGGSQCSYFVLSTSMSTWILKTCLAPSIRPLGRFIAPSQAQFCPTYKVMLPPSSPMTQTSCLVEFKRGNMNSHFIHCNSFPEVGTHVEIAATESEAEIGTEK